MRSLHLRRHAFSLGVAAALLAGCGGSQPPLVVGSETPQRASVSPLHGLRAIYSFKGNPDGEQPNSNIVAPERISPYPQLVGTTEFGGYSNVGTVYGLTKARRGPWMESVLYEFHGSSDGWRPNGIAIPGHLDGNSPVFVTSFAGGASNFGAVAVLRPTRSGTWTLLSAYSFAGNPDGAAPFGPVIADRSGNVYGTTSSGGGSNNGTVYRLQPKGSRYTESILYSFQGGADGGYPVAGLTIDGNNALYGTTEYGGTAGHGTVFKLTPSGTGYTESVLYSFRGSPDGSQPMASLCRGASGALYGTTSLGGSKNNGTVFELLPSGSVYVESVLWQFGTVHGDGAFPEGSVIVDTRANIYGTTIAGGPSGSGGIGTFFVLKPASPRSPPEKLYYFNGYNGGGPSAGPTADHTGNLFIPASGNGAHLFGAVAQAPVTAGTSACSSSTL